MEIGDKIKRLRVQNGLTQEELADRSELTKGFISQVERNLTSPSISTLIDILEGLGTNLQEFFNESIAEKIVFSKEDAFETVSDKLKYTLNWIIPNAQKNAMEPILIELGYVISGIIYIHIGVEKYKVKKDESFYYIANSNHFISNAGKTNAKVIWVSTPPSF